MNMMAKGGEPEQDDHDSMMDQVAMEAMTAIENKDKDGFKSALEVLLQDLIHKMQNPQE